MTAKASMRSLTTLAMTALPALAAAAESASTGLVPEGGVSESTLLLAAIFKVLGALALVVLLMVVVVFVLKKAGFPQAGSRRSSLIRVLESKMVAPKKYIAIVEVAGTTLAVGIADQSINLLTTLDLGEQTAATPAPGNDPPKGGGRPFAEALASAAKALTGRLSPAAQSTPEVRP